MPDEDDDGIDWAEVGWMDQELKGELPCCDYRDHSGDDAVCPCPKHPRSYLHPFGEDPWPAP